MIARRINEQEEKRRPSAKSLGSTSPKAFLDDNIRRPETAEHDQKYPILVYSVKLYQVALSSVV